MIGARRRRPGFGLSSLYNDDGDVVRLFRRRKVLNAAHDGGHNFLGGTGAVLPDDFGYSIRPEVLLIGIGSLADAVCI